MANSLLHTAIIVEPDFATDVGKINLRVAQLVLRRHAHNNDDDNEFLACSLQPLYTLLMQLASWDFPCQHRIVSSTYTCFIISFTAL